MDIQFMSDKKNHYLGFENTSKIFYSEFPLAQFIITCPRKNICNSCEQKYVSGDTLYSVGNDEQQEYFAL